MRNSGKTGFADTGGTAHWDVAIVLGARLGRGGEPSASLERRTRKGVELIVSGLATDLILTGGGNGARPEAEAMAEIVLAAGVAPDRIHLDPHARDTLENAANAIGIARSNGWSRGVVVTDPYHLLRARFAFAMQGWRVAGMGSEPWTMRHLAASLRELAALPVYLVRLIAAGRS